MDRGDPGKLDHRGGRVPRRRGEARRGLPRRHRAGRRRHPALAVRRLAGRRRPPGPRPGQADGRGAGASTTLPPGCSRTGRATSSTAGTGSSPSRRAAFSTGFVHEGLRLAVLTGDDLSGQKASTRDMRKMPARRKKQIDPLELEAGDYVVHEQHGVGRFVEMRQREVQGATREYLVLEYGASKRGGPPTGSTCPPTRWTRSPAMSAASSRQPRPARRRRLGQAQEPGPQGGPPDRGRADQAVRRPPGHPGITRSGRTRPGSASSRTRSRSTRPPTS